ncbi:hypothetical protein [Ascidiimonas aurantiaca]|uniref:hypothetical protein n=1 Tax=Ascidiimonas aurantiaca TaxID=1685432 RepID=UPI0030ECDE4A
MNKFLIICGLLFGQEAATQQEDPGSSASYQEATQTTMTVAYVKTEAKTKEYALVLSGKEEASPLDLNSIEYIEEEIDLDLGFDPDQYLPRGFDPYKPYFDINSIEYIKDEKCPDLGFDTSEYLPENFDPYDSYFDIHSIEYIDDEAQLDMGYNVAEYLPEDFNPHEPYFDIHSVEYVDEDEDAQIVMGFEPGNYLPKGFDPYVTTTSF